ncbi:hypothetical protein [Bacillus cereus group sp. BfR-BA-01383]|uniref:hypothetical protein n=1 Tax=Bacillus cereus group sp. BfR-BA-01383 TaxID=2920327 RepID=UPI001F5A7343|nr:hypothetical protein [Bacillus cereus group sp. BfR-BA-01383]
MTKVSNEQYLSIQEREQLVKAFIENYQVDKIRMVTHRIGNKKYELSAYELPLELTYCSHKNSRIGAERMQYEKGHNVVIEEGNPRHMKAIMNMLLPNNEESENLINQMKAPGQTEPGLITKSGRLINANRRRAALERIGAKTILVSILPDETTEEELFDIELGLQITTDYKEDYKGINRLFMIRRGIELKHSIENLSKKFSMKKKDIERGLKVLEKVEEFLEEIGKPYEYTEVENMLEHFYELVKESERILQEDGDVVLIEEVFYGLMKHNMGEKQNIIGHKEIRDTLLYASQDPKIFNLLASSAESTDVEKVQTNLKIAKDLAAMYKNKETIAKTIAKLVKQIDSINIEQGFSTYKKGDKVQILAELRNLEAQTKSFIQEVLDEAGKPKYL